MNERSATQTYIRGFITSIFLTLGSFFLVLYKPVSHLAITTLIVAFALIQTIVQLYAFLHLGQESKPRWNLIALLFMILVFVIIIFGSLWIMSNLDYNTMTMMPPDLHHQ